VEEPSTASKPAVSNRSKQPLIRALKASPAVMIDYVEATRSRRIGGMLTVSV
jgi:hypothetical protein